MMDEVVCKFIRVAIQRALLALGGWSDEIR